jgi:DNA-binding transcriptional ArsR family regulator
MQELPPSAGWPAAAPVFAALGDGTRLALVARLSSGEPLSITQLAAGANITRQAITKHLHVLEEAGVVHSARRGREQLWELDPSQLAEARRCLEQIAGEWERALGSLKDFVESGEEGDAETQSR